MAKVKTWCGPARCDFCQKEVIKEGESFYDAATRFGPCGCMCSSCFKEHGYGETALGTGHGQKYTVHNGVLRKVSG